MLSQCLQKYSWGTGQLCPKEENIMGTDNSFPGIFGTGSAENYTDEKYANGNNNFNANSQRSMQMPPLVLLGGGEGSLGAASWNANQGQAKASWGGNSGGSNPGMSYLSFIY